MIQVTEANTRKALKDFIDFPHELYRYDLNYVPELFIAQRDLLTKHPFHNHSRLKLFLAHREGKVVGRIAAIYNNRHNGMNGVNEGFFGFFDCVEDVNVAQVLLGEVHGWLGQKDVSAIIGPVNFSTNETCGLLIDGFDTPPVAMMTYNKPYYADLLEKVGYAKKTDLFAYQIKAGSLNDRSVQLHDSLVGRLGAKGIRLRQINLKKFDAEVNGLMEAYNSAWDKNLGFVPMTREEFVYLAKDLKLILDPEFCMVAEHEGKIIGFSLAIPDINQILIRVKRGRLLPTGIFRLLLERKSIKSIRIIALGVLERYRKMGIEAVFYGDIIRKCTVKGIATAEASWILEDNVMMNRAIQQINGKIYKTYRLYSKVL